MTTEEIIGILIGTGAAPGILYLLISLIRDLVGIYKCEKSKGKSNIQSMNTAVRSLKIKKPKNKQKS